MKISRQRAWQIKQKDLGNCTKCGKPAGGKVLCDAHSAGKRGQRNRTAAEWSAVDWSLPVKDIAVLMGVTANAVYAQKLRHHPKP